MSSRLALAIETSGLHGSVAVGRDGRVVGWRGLRAERRHTGELLPAIRELLAEAGGEPRDVEILCFSQGPGSFTGLRLAATVARMWQSAVGCQVVAVPTLEVIARNALTCPDAPRRLAVVLDARQGRVFSALFAVSGQQQGPAEATELQTLAPAGLHDAESWLRTLERPCAVLGDGVRTYQRELAAAGLEILPERYWRPDARQVLLIGWRLAAAGRFCRPEEIVPAYLRPPECQEVYERRRAAARRRRGE